MQCDVMSGGAVSPSGPPVFSGQTSRLRVERLDLLNKTAQQLMAQSRLVEARTILERVIERDPANTQAMLFLATALEAMGLIEESMATFDRACQIAPDNIGLLSASVFACDRRPESTLEDGFRIRQRFAQIVKSRTPAPQPHTNTRDPERKLRIGYVSGDMRNHSAAKVFAAVVVNHESREFDVCAYATQPGSDWMTETLKAGIPHWRDVSDWSNERLYEQIRADQIDILVDLSGHSAGNRLHVFARKPAPVQITAWGYITGTGLPEIDYMFADEDTVYPSEEQWYAEKIIRLPRIVSFSPTDPSLVGPVMPLPALKNGYLTYGVINRVGKLKLSAIELWARILAAVPDARLIIKASGMEIPQVRGMVQSRFEQFGANLAQLQFRGGTDSIEHQKTYNEIDVGLDPYPDGGGVSTLEALWMGVPHVTLPHRQIASRLTTSFQKELGLPWLSASSGDEYVERAVQLNTQRAELAEVRGLLRDMMCSSSLCDSLSYTRAVEDVYRACWRQWCAEQTAHDTARPVVTPLPRAGHMTLVGA